MNPRTPPSAADVFDDIYRRDLWGHGGSGWGSTPAQAAPYVRLVRALAAEGRWASVVDLGCGDGRVAASLALPGYRGFDASDAALALFAANAPGLRADRLDFAARRDLLPPADALLAKDVLNHWPNFLVADFVAWAASCGRWRSVYFTQDATDRPHRDCPLGGHRPLHPPSLAPLGLEVVAEFGGKAALRLVP